MQHLIKEITQWQDSTFPESTSLSRALHLEREVSELIKSLKYEDNVNTKKEFADCFILLFGTAYKYGFDWQNLYSLIREKHEINLLRKWKQPDEYGVVEHEKTDDEKEIIELANPQELVKVNIPSFEEIELQEQYLEVEKLKSVIEEKNIEIQEQYKVISDLLGVLLQMLLIH